jgi:hypothetical protein
MPLLFQIEGATRLDVGVWKARLSPADLRLLDPRAESNGAITVLLLSDDPRFDVEKKQLSFDPSKVKLLNVGTSDTAILVGGVPTDTTPIRSTGLAPAAIGSGDSRFLNALPSHLNELGTKLLQGVRRKYPGDLTFYETSGKYVEAPDNFWTVRPQPRDESFRITVRGRPESFKVPATLELKPDMTGYTSFKVERIGQIEEFLRVLDQIRRK